MIKKIAVIILASVFLVSGYAQQKTAKIEFDKLSYDFGRIEEKNGNVSFTFKFTNTGQVPLVITNVVASCGCTTPVWTKQPILPGMKGEVTATYNPANRPGKFDKSITVTSNAANNPVALKITGDVVARERSIEEIYPSKMGGLRLKTTVVSFFNIAPKDTKTQNLEVVNTSNQPISISFKEVPKHIKMEAKPKTLKAGEKGNIEITYLTELKNDWDYVYDRIILVTNDKPVEDNQITVSANIREDFSQLSPEQKANAAKLVFDKTEINFGNVSQTQKTTGEFIISNNGKTDLIIRKVKASCGCTAVNPQKMLLKPGEKTSMKVIFDPAGKAGAFNKSITVITNDPNQYKQMVVIKGVIQQ